jgi:hypothetical protein
MPACGGLGLGADEAFQKKGRLCSRSEDGALRYKSVRLKTERDLKSLVVARDLKSLVGSVP